MKDSSSAIVEGSSASQPNSEKLRILVFHGYRQNGDTFKQKLGSLRKRIKQWADLTFITAPHKVTPLVSNSNGNGDGDQAEEDTGQVKAEEQFGWFFNREDLTFAGIRQGGPAIGFEESLRLVEDAFKNQGPFDGIMGFSQGACFVSLLCSMQQKDEFKHNFKFAIMAAGFKSGSVPHLTYYGDRIPLPTLHILGETDQVIPAEMSESLATCFENPSIVRHSGGHYFPATAAQKPDYQKFLEAMLETNHRNK